MNDGPQVTLAALAPTKPLNKFERNFLGNKMRKELEAGAGKNVPFRLSVGDKVEDFFMYTPPLFVGTVSDLYRENGHNRVETEQGFHREQDLRKVG